MLQNERAFHMEGFGHETGDGKSEKDDGEREMLPGQWVSWGRGVVAFPLEFAPALEVVLTQGDTEEGVSPEELPCETAEEQQAVCDTLLQLNLIKSL
jgi:hypothetical protein